MAVSKIWAIHSNSLDTLEYISRADKSNDGALVFSALCSNDPALADFQMSAHRKRFGKDKGILMHHGFVSFQKNEVSAEMAYEFAKTFMKSHFDGYQYFGSIHVDTEHIHFNFAINSVGLDGYKYNGCTKNLEAMRAEVDRCCGEYGLSIVVPKGKGMSYKEWKDKDKNSSIIKADIDKTILLSDSFEHFVELMISDGYSVKYGDNVKHMLFKKEGMGRGARGGTLGAAYTEETIKKRIQFKEFNFIPLKSNLRKPGKKLKPIERELMSIYYRRPTMATNVAMGLHLLNSYMTGNRHKIMRYTTTPAKKNKINKQYQTEVKKLARQINFCHANNIKSRQDLERQIVDLEKQILSENTEQNKDMLNEFYELQKSLDAIKERTITDKMQQEVEKEDIKQNNIER